MGHKIIGQILGIMKIDQVNQRLKAAHLRVAIENQNGWLHLRATLPPKPNSTNSFPHQQRIALKLPETPLGLKQAEKEAKKLAALLDCREFDWKDWGYSPIKNLPMTLGEWVERFQADYFARRGNTPEVQTTWKTNYHQVFSRLPSNHPISSQLLYEQITILTQANTRTRKKFCQALNALARFANLDNFDVKALQGNYSPRTVAPRDLPEDKVIADWLAKIPNPAWQWVYGMMATFGLRNHEVFFVNPDHLLTKGICEVLEGKTNQRRVWGLYPEWIDAFNLKDIKFPDCHGTTHADYGARVTNAFARYGIPFPPYTLRHCWAVRSLEFGLDISLAAAQMGHSVKEHSQTYHHWISDRTHQRAYDLIVQRSDRPFPP